MTQTQSPHPISPEYYALEDLRWLVDTQPRLELHPAARAKIDACARFVLKKAAQDQYIYGVNTGFGSLCETRVGSDEIEALQYNHVVSHACGCRRDRSPSASLA